MTIEQSSKEQIADKANLSDSDGKKPLLLQILEKYLQGDFQPAARNNNSMLEKEQSLTDAKASSMKPKNMSSSASPDQRSDAFIAKSSAAKGSAGPGIQFSDEKNDQDIDQPSALGIGDGIVSGQKTKSNNKTDKHIDKANSLLDELSREEKSGFKAEIASGSDHLGAAPDTSKNDKLPENKLGKFNNVVSSSQDQ